MTLPSRDYYMSLVRVLLTFHTGKIASQQHEDLTVWRERWQHLHLLKEEARLSKQSTKETGTANSGEQATSRLSGQVLYAALHRGEYVQLHPVATDLGGVRAVAFSPEGNLLATGHGAKTVQLWDTVSQQKSGPPLFGHTDLVDGISFSPDGALLATASLDGTVRLWDVTSRTAISEPLESHSDGATAAFFSPDAPHLITVGRTMRVWDIRNVNQPQKIGRPLASGLVARPAISPTGLVATGHTNGVTHLWDLKEEQKLGGPLRGHAQDVSAVAFSPDGQLLATAGHDVQLWDVSSHEMIHEPLPCNDEPVWSMAFSPDGSTLAAVTGHREGRKRQDHSVRLWDTATWTPIGKPLAGHTGSIRAAAFSPDSRLYTTGGDDGLLRLRILPTARGWQ
ncbi:WD40 repeat domain-containing protein [Streptomyces sp. NPDC023998]|uniref:WD40 repeat domain-containing protein n=1 Tax=Streptomyces sp. NPDC023998 TaxID=3154597 RepID=UPI003401ECA1